MKKYLYSLLAGYFSFYILRGTRTLVVDSSTEPLRKALEARSIPCIDNSLTSNGTTLPPPDYFVLNGNLHYVLDIQVFLEELRTRCAPPTRVLISYYSSLWKPLFRLADRLGLRSPRSTQVSTKHADENWIAPSDLENLLRLSGFELVSTTPRVLLPLYIPLVSTAVNRWLAPLPIFRLFAMVNVAIARPVFLNGGEPSVSVVVAARNEAGNMEALFKRLPSLGSKTELVIIEGGSTDGTWEEIERLKAANQGAHFSVLTAKQDGKGKGDAIRKGFDLATQDLLMILDADLTVPPEELPKFYNAIRDQKGEFINGSRLVYPMEKEAMRFFNILGNKFFASAFSFILGQTFKDTLCGTKVLSREAYRRVAENRSYFGEFDPFGDFDLIFGAVRLGLKVTELPIRYKERAYGETNISRWKHGWLLLRMVIFAARRIKFV